MLILKNLIREVEAQETVDGLIFNNPIDAKDIFELIAALLTFVSRVGAAIVVFMIIYSGFLFVKAQGDPGELEKAKKTFLWTVIGGVVLIGAQTLAMVVKNTAAGLGAGI